MMIKSNLINSIMTVINMKVGFDNDKIAEILYEKL